MPDSIRTLFVTDVPFWECQTGAQFRILQLYEQLNVDSFTSKVLFTRPLKKWEPKRNIGSDSILQMDLSRPPAFGLWQKIKWHLRATLNALGLGRRKWSPTFQHYYPPEVVDRFVSLVDQVEPNVLILEYATQT